MTGTLRADCEPLAVAALAANFDAVAIAAGVFGLETEPLSCAVSTAPRGVTISALNCFFCAKNVLGSVTGLSGAVPSE